MLAAGAKIRGFLRCLHEGDERPGIALLFEVAYKPAGVQVLHRAPTRFAAQHMVRLLVHEHDVFHQRLVLRLKGQFAEVEPADKIELLPGSNAQPAREPKLVDATGAVRIAVARFFEPVGHVFGADAPRHFLIIPHHRVRKGAWEVVVAVPGGDATLHAVPRQGKVAARDHTRLQADEGIADLEGGGRRPRKIKPRVAADHVLPRLQVEQGKAARQALVGEEGVEGGIQPRVLGEKGGGEEQEGWKEEDF